ncbi:unnamed protein product [marine sediment metagenome]|uniref:Uncharacterized protein n=1 Tax=marine sediment metagenome TaxID=412755 RepID=X0RGJ5_9ZZZZ
MTDNIPGDVSTRCMCAILDNMRECLKTNNFSYLSGLIEEVQYRTERMEDAIGKLDGWEGVRDLEKKRTRLKEEISKLEAEKARPIRARGIK